MEGKSSRIDSERATPAIVPRAYQLEILRIARARNTLAFLPTASGKTLIAILLIQVRLEIIRSEIGRGGNKKLIAFLAPTRVLVNQQKDSIQQHCRDFVVRDYTGDSSRQGKKIENLGLSEWKKECQETDIMVFTPQILRQVLEHGFVPVSLFDLIVLDECHHAFGKDSMAVVCELVKRSPVKPLLLGLTGSPVPCKKGSISAKIAQLEFATGCKLVCPRDTLADLRSLVPTAQIALLRYNAPAASVPIGGHWTLHFDHILAGPGSGAATVTDSRLYGEVGVSIMPHHRQFSVSLDGRRTLHHALMRVRHAYSLALLFEQRSWSQLSVEEFNALSGFTLPSIATISMGESSSSATPAAAAASSLLETIVQTIGQISLICEECGVLCALHAMLTAVSPRDIEEKFRRALTNGFGSENGVEASGESVDVDYPQIDSNSREDLSDVVADMPAEVSCDQEDVEDNQLSTAASGDVPAELSSDSQPSDGPAADAQTTVSDDPEMTDGAPSKPSASPSHSEKSSKLRSRRGKSSSSSRAARSFYASQQQSSVRRQPSVARGPPAPGSVPSFDLEKIKMWVDELLFSPFDREVLCNGELISCYSLVDTFAVLSLSLAEGVRKKAAKTLFDFVQQETRDAGTDSCTGTGNQVGGDYKKPGEWNASRQRSHELVLSLLDTNFDKDKKEEASSTSSTSTSESMLTVEYGSWGVSVHPLICEDILEADSYRLADVKEAISNACIALLVSVSPEEWRVAVGLKYSSTLPGSRATTKEGAVITGNSNTQRFSSSSTVVTYLEYLDDQKEEKEGSEERSAPASVSVPVNGHNGSKPSRRIDDPERNESKLPLVTQKFMALVNMLETIRAARQRISSINNGCTSPSLSNSRADAGVGGEEDHSQPPTIFAREISEFIAAEESSSEDFAVIVFCRMRLAAVSMSRIFRLLIQQQQQGTSESKCLNSAPPMDSNGSEAIGDSKEGQLLLANAEDDQLLISEVCAAPENGARSNESATSGAVTLRPHYLIGRSSQTEQMRTLNAFKQGEFNVLFATEVAEEGLDVRACQLVVNFDTVDSVKSFIQRRGRARAANARMISLTPIGSEGDQVRKDLLKYQEQEQEMIARGIDVDDPAALLVVKASSTEANLCTLRDVLDVAVATASEIPPPSDELDYMGNYIAEREGAHLQRKGSSSGGGNGNGSGDFEDAQEDGGKGDEDLMVCAQDGLGPEFTEYRSTTGAVVDVRTAAQILLRYCQQLARDDCHIPKPIYWITRYGREGLTHSYTYRCAVLLPSSVPAGARCAISPHTTNKNLARAIVSLICIRELHRYGELNDWFYAAGCKGAVKAEKRAVDNTQADSSKAEMTTLSSQSQSQSRSVPQLRSLKDDSVLLNVEVKITPDHCCCVDPAPAQEEAAAASPAGGNAESATAMVADASVSRLSRSISDSTSIRLFFYSFRVKCDNGDTQARVFSCHGCLSYLRALNRVGIAYLKPLSDEVLKQHFAMCLREMEPLSGETVFLGSRDVSKSELFAMQKFHKAILCWETFGVDINAADEPLPPDGDKCCYPAAADSVKDEVGGVESQRSNKAGVRYMSPSEWKRVHENGVNGEDVEETPVDFAEWTQSGKGAWYCLYPLADDSSAVPGFGRLAPDASLNIPGSGSVDGAAEQDPSCEKKKNSSSPSPTALTPKVAPWLLCEEKGLSWLSFLRQCASDTQFLIHNLRAQQAMNSEGKLQQQKATDEEMADFRSSLPLHEHNGVRDLEGKILAKGPGALYLGLDGFYHHEVTLLHAAKYLKPEDVREYPGFVPPEPIHLCKCENSAMLAWTHLDDIISKVPHRADFMKSLMARKPDHRLAPGLPITTKLTLAPLLGSIKDISRNPRGGSSSKPSGPSSLVVRRCRGCDEDRKFPSSSLNLQPSWLEGAEAVLQSLRVHNHARMIWMVPEFCCIIGEAKWYFAGIVAPSLVWRIQSLVLAEEARGAINLLIREYKLSSGASSSSQLLAPAGRVPSTAIVDNTSVSASEKIKSEDLHKVSLSLILEAMTPRMANESMNSERLEMLGDCILKLLTTVELYRLYPDRSEGFLTNMRMKYITNMHLINMSVRFNIVRFIRALPLSSGKQHLLFKPSGLSEGALASGRSIWNRIIDAAENVDVDAGNGTKDKSTSKKSKTSSAKTVANGIPQQAAEASIEPSPLLVEPLPSTIPETAVDHELTHQIQSMGLEGGAPLEGEERHAVKDSAAVEDFVAASSCDCNDVQDTDAPVITDGMSNMVYSAPPVSPGVSSERLKMARLELLLSEARNKVQSLEERSKSSSNASVAVTAKDCLPKSSALSKALCAADAGEFAIDELTVPQLKSLLSDALSAIRSLGNELSDVKRKLSKLQEKSGNMASSANDGAQSNRAAYFQSAGSSTIPDKTHNFVSDAFGATSSSQSQSAAPASIVSAITPAATTVVEPPTLTLDSAIAAPASAPTLTSEVLQSNEGAERCSKINDAALVPSSSLLSSSSAAVVAGESLKQSVSSILSPQRGGNESSQPGESAKEPLPHVAAAAAVAATTADAAATAAAAAAGGEPAVQDVHLSIEDKDVEDKDSSLPLKTSRRRKSRSPKSVSQLESACSLAQDPYAASDVLFCKEGQFNCQYAIATVKAKCLADLIEALLGAYYLHGGLEATREVLQALGTWPSAPTVLPTVCAGTSEKSGQLLQDVEKEEGILLVDYSASSHTPVIPEGYPEQLRRIALGLGHGHGQRTLVAQRQKEMLLELKEGGEEDADVDAVTSAVTVEDDDGTTATFTVNDSDSDEKDGNSNPADAATELEPPPLCDDAEHPIPKNQLEFLEMAAAAIEENFGYRFDNLKILREALTHCSVVSQRSNERMEFLGDAVLDFGVVSILFTMNIRADEGQLSMMKVAITNNANLAIVAAKLRLHRWLIHSSDQLTAEIEALEDKLDIIDKASLIKASSQEPSSSISFAEEKMLPHAEAEHVANSLMKSSKTLADAFEALIGAIYLDSQCSLEVIQDIVERLHLVPPAESWDFSLFT